MTAFPQNDRLLSRIGYNPSLRGHVGVEREFFLTQECNGSYQYQAWMGIGWSSETHYVPRSPDFLAAINDPAWTYELSACQVEHRTDPNFELADIRSALTKGLVRGRRVAESLGLRLDAVEVAPDTMPLDIYPHDARYAAIAKTLPRPVRSAACRVTGTHFHVGCASADEALAVHNALVPHLDRLAVLGDHSKGERIRLYKMMATNWQSPLYDSAEHFDAVAKEQGFADSLRNCWHLIRISRHGTVELRMFGMTDDVDENVAWVKEVRKILRGI